MSSVARVSWLLALAVLIAGCGYGQEGDLGPNSSAFEGLPADVVAERLGDPVLKGVLRDEPTGSRAGMAQLNVSSTVFCRDVLRAERRWVTTGEQPDVPGVVSPANPEPGFDAFMDSWVEMVREAIDSGDPAVLREWLVLTGGCRDVVADPSLSATRTVADVLAQ
ncbi:MAG: hypothetical protein FWD59_03260 [Micrococcales bacterium]|nr:hypothetical protein [Micrococcales bacterium]